MVTVLTSTSDLIKQQFNVTSSADVEHKTKQRFLIDFIGYEELKNVLPFTKAEIKNAIVKDIYLNNLPLGKWDNMGGFKFLGNREVVRTTTPFTLLLKNKGLYCSSPSCAVSLLKEVARMVAEEEG